ncbi:hypothetical protein RQP46_011068 [Phenoliferia psychrophenolica]
MRSLVAPLQMDANSRGLAFETSFDPRIDALAKTASGLEEGKVVEGDGVVIGDEMRLRQVVTNLASNSCKFTLPGGKVKITTRLIYPTQPPPSPVRPSLQPMKQESAATGWSGQSEATTLVSQTSYGPHKPIPPSSERSHTSSESLVVRIEVVDSGVGIHPRDVGGLFSAYVQTEAGLSQGGKGTGLGLSLVRHIVALMGGRLGVKSCVGQGTTMWVELPYGIGVLARESIDELDFAAAHQGGEKLAKVLLTPQSYVEADEVEFDFLSTPPLLRKTSIRPLAFGSRRTAALMEDAATFPRPGPPSPSPSQAARDPSTPSNIVLTLPPPHTSTPTSGGDSYFDPRPLTSRPADATTPRPSAISRPSLVRAPTMKALNFDRGPLRVLVVDDDQLTRRLMRRMMERLGCEVSDAENGAVALELLLDQKNGGGENFEVTFLDNQMPVCSGLQVITKLRSLRRRDFVVGVTANAQLHDQEEFTQQGASVVLTKPIAPFPILPSSALAVPVPAPASALAAVAKMSSSVKREGSPTAGPSSRPLKAAKMTLPDDPEPTPAPALEPSTTASKMAAASLVHALADATECAPAWSRTNLLAVASPPTASYSSLLTSDAPPPPTIALTHFAGAPSSPSKGKHTARHSFSLSLPPSSRPSRISRLAFSPCGGYLLAVRAVIGDRGDSIVVWEQRDGCINEWDLVWDERVGRFGGDEREGDAEGKHVVQLRFLGEERKWYATPDVPDGDYVRPSRPLFCAPPRSPPLIGIAFVAILSSAELLFVHLPRLTPLIPLTALLPLSSHLSTTALPTPQLSSKNASQGAIDDLVANLVDGMPDNATEIGTTRLLIATVTAPTSLTPPAASLPSRTPLEALGLVEPLPQPSSPDPDAGTPDFDMSDFGLLDEAFGNEQPAAGASGAGGGGGAGGEDGPIVVPMAARRKRSGERREDVVEMCEVRIEMTLPEGPRISLHPLSPLHIADPSASPSSPPGLLTHLTWLEDSLLPPPPIATPRASEHKLPPEQQKLESVKFDAEVAAWRILLSVREAKEAGVDLRLVAVVASKVEGRQCSRMTAWAFSNPLYTLSDAFAGLECKKADVLLGPREWLPRRVASKAFEGLVSFVLPSDGPHFASFLVGQTKKTGEEGLERTFVTPLDSTTLEPRLHDGETQLPGSSLYSSACVSPSRGVICALPFAQLQLQPVMAAVSLALEPASVPTELGIALAVAVSRQVDTSDLVGRVVGLKDDASSVLAMTVARDTLQSMMRPGVSLSDTPLELERLGAVASIYKASSNLTLRGSIAYDVTQLAACVRAFSKCEKKPRIPEGLGYQCESDAIWPLIGYLTWYCDFCRDLVQSINGLQSLTPGIEPSARLILILHPLPRALLLRAATCILGLQSFLGSFQLGSNVVVDVSRSVLDDVVNYNGLILTEWSAMLVRVGALEGFSGVSPELQDLLTKFIIPTTLSNSITMALALLSLPSLFLTLPPSPPTTPASANNPDTLPALDLVRKGPTPASANNPDTLPALDLVRKGRLPTTGAFKECTKCGGRTERKEVNATDAGKWAGIEMAWQGRCCCGGLWVARTV